MLRFVDQIGKEITLNHSPKRMVSLVPSQTELLFDLGLDDEVVGLTNFCVHPREKFLAKPRIGGTKSPDIVKIKQLQPDLVIANKEENNKSDVELIERICPVWTSDISTIQDAYEMISAISALVGKAREGEIIRATIEQKFNKIKRVDNKRVLYLIWKKPYMAAGSDTFIHEIIKAAGWTNVISDIRYPEVTHEQIDVLNPDLILLSSEPYPFKERDVDEFNTAFATSKILLVDGELFSWYGSRLVKTPEYLSSINNTLYGTS